MANDVKTDAPPSEPDPRAGEISKLRSRVRKKIGAPRGRPAKETPVDLGTAGDGGAAATDGGQHQIAPTPGPSRSESVASPRLDVMQMVDFIKSYHVVGGYMFPTHRHWREIPDERVQAAAQTLCQVSDKIPAPARAALASILSLGAVSMALYETMGAPMLLSLKIRKSDKAAAVAALEGEAGGAEK